MTKHAAPALLTLLVGALMPAPASAQLIGSNQPPPAEVRRPYRGLFGSPGDPNTPQSLVLSASLFGAYDENVTSGVTGQNVDPRLQRSGEYYGASAALAYSLAKTSQRASFGLSSGVSANMYRIGETNRYSPHGQVSANFGYALGRRTAINFHQNVVYTRFYRFQLFPSITGEDDDGALAGDPDVELFERAALRYASGVGFTQGLSDRSSLSLNYAFGYVDRQDDQFPDWKSQSASIRFARTLTEHATLNLGYGYHTAESQQAGRRPTEAHNINAGVSYSRALSFSRRTSFSFSTGSSILAREDLSVPDSDPRARFRLIGNAALTHELGRTWTAHAAYHRGLVFREGFDDPFLTDSLMASISGFVSRRLDFTGAARWSFASIDRVGSSNHGALAATAQARYALSRFLALYARYIYYQYEFDEGIPLEPGLARTLDRQGVRVGITTSIPLIR